MKRIAFLTLLLVQGYSFALTPDEKSKIVENVYNKVWSSIGTAEAKPKFLFDTKQSSMIAYMMNNKDGFPMIGFEEKAFDICASLGNRRDDAIAYLIGHEISHHNLKHHWGKQFASAYSVAGLGKTIRGIDSDGIVRFETQADERGGILCFLAGYNTAGISDKLLRGLYTGYGIQDGPKYPSLEERIQIAKDQDSIVATYVKVFEAGNYAMLLKEYDVAISCYEFLIGKSFHSREIYNNIGVMYYLRALEAAGPDEVKYVFPVEIDLESIRNRGGAKGFGDNVLEDFNKAISYFEKASQFDKTYATSVLNKSCIYAILKDYRNAKYWAEEALTLAQKENKTSVINNSKLVLALVHYEDPLGDKALSSRLMDELVAVNHDFAIINKQIIDGKEPSEIVFTKPLGWMGDDEASVGSTGIAASEKIEGIRDYANATYNFTQEIRFANNSTMQAGTRDQSVVLMVPFKMSTMIFHYTTPTYTGQMSKGLKAGATGKQLQEAYGAPNVIMPSRQGWIYLYSKNKMMVFLDENKSINKWVVYSEL